MDLAKLHKKILAYIVDLLLSSIFPASIVILAYFLVRPILDLYIYILIFIGLEIVFYTLMNALLLRIAQGKTVGGTLFSTRLIRSDLSPLTFGDCLIRSISLAILPLAIINLIYLLCAHQERAPYDQISDTILVDDTKKKY